MTEENKTLDSEKTVLSMDDLTTGESFPEVKENAIEAVKETQAAAVAEQKQNEQAAKIAGVKLKKDGTPAKKRGRKSASETTQPKEGFYNPNTAQKQVPNGSVPVSSLYAAQVTSGIIEQASIKLISKEFTLLEAERIANIEAWKNLFDSQGGVNLTPAQAVMLSHAAIIGTRLATGKETQSKTTLAVTWIKTKYWKWKNRNALSDNRENAKRQNDVRKKESGESEKTKSPDIGS